MNSINKLLSELSELEAKATKGPWRIVLDKDGDVERVHAIERTGCDEEDNGYNEVGIVKLPVEKYGYGCAWASEPNGEFIATSRNTLPKLIEAIKVLVEAIESSQRVWHHELCGKTHGHDKHHMCCDSHTKALAKAEEILK